jgi:hypothetical protein
MSTVDILARARAAARLGRNVTHERVMTTSLRAIHDVFIDGHYIGSIPPSDADELRDFIERLTSVDLTVDINGHRVTYTAKQGETEREMAKGMARAISEQHPDVSAVVTEDGGGISVGCMGRVQHFTLDIEVGEVPDGTG